MLDYVLFDVLLFVCDCVFCVCVGIMCACVVCDGDDDMSDDDIGDAPLVVDNVIVMERNVDEKRRVLSSSVTRASIKPILDSIRRKVGAGKRAFVLVGTKGVYSVKERSKDIVMSKCGRVLCDIDVIDVSGWSDDERRVLLRGIKEPYVLFKDDMYSSKVYELSVSGCSSMDICKDKLPASTITVNSGGYTIRLTGPSAEELAWLTLIRKVSNSEGCIEEVVYE